MIENCFNFLSALVDGVYGWQDEVLTLIAIIVIFNFIARWGLKWLHARFEKQKKQWQASFVKALIAPLIFYTWFFSVVHASNLIMPQIVTTDFFVKMHLLLEIVAVLSFAWFIMRWKKLLLRVISQKIKRHEVHFDQSKVDVIDKLITIVVIFITIMLLLEVTHRSMSTLIAFGGIGGLAIAFASQEMIANYFSGVMIYTTRPFSVGDWITIPEKDIEGYVEEIGWYMTRIQTFEKRPIYVPNSIFAKIAVITPSRMSHRRFKEHISLRYQDLPSLKALLADINKMFRHHKDIDQDLKIITHLSELGKSSIEIEVSAYTTALSTEAFTDLKQELLFNILDILKAHKAEIAAAFPITEISIRDGISLKQREPEFS